MPPEPSPNDNTSHGSYALVQRRKGFPMAQGMSRSRFLTVSEVAELMRVSSMTVYRLIKASDLRAVRVGKSYRVREEDFDAYLAKRYTAAG